MNPLLIVNLVTIVGIGLIGLGVARNIMVNNSGLLLIALGLILALGGNFWYEEVYQDLCEDVCQRNGYKYENRSCTKQNNDYYETIKLEIINNQCLIIKEVNTK